jgi:tetratricopeptide (TPR) repeat protein
MLNSDYQKLLRKADSKFKNNNEAIQVLGEIIDASSDFNDLNGLEKALALSEKLEQKKLSSEQFLTLYYFISNIWASLYWINTKNKPISWHWEQPEAEKQIVYLRKSLTEKAFHSVQKERRCQIYTNLGNLLNNVGRIVEAIETWEKATKLIPEFGMAQANLAKGIGYYGHTLYDKNNIHDSLVLLKYSLTKLRESINLKDIYPYAKKDFKDFLHNLEEINNKFDFINHHPITDISFGDTDIEINYRKWTLKNRLFLNFLNDVDLTTSQGAIDNALLPTLTRPISEKSSHFEGLFNQMKQEFVSARFMYFEGISSQDVHFSDKGVSLYNTLDYPSYSISIEKIKTAFRLSYSILDKIAFFLNEYLSLGIKQNQVSFRTFWYENRDRKKGLRSEFTNKENWALRGLFWLSKDLYEDEEMFRVSIEPDAQELAVIRNHLEHKYLKVHEFGKPVGMFVEDLLAFSIGRKEISSKTLQVLKMARSSLIYLVLSVNKEEQERSKNYNGKVGEIFIDTFDDEWKV